MSQSLADSCRWLVPAISTPYGVHISTRLSSWDLAKTRRFIQFRKSNLPFPRHPLDRSFDEIISRLVLTFENVSGNHG
jgi:hypothetical protein